MSKDRGYAPAIDHPYRVSFDGDFSIADAPTAPPKEAPSDKEAKKALGKVVENIEDHQRELYADDRYSILCVFQAMDAAGKDSTIRAVMTGVNPAGFQVFSFKQPSAEELDHDFLWRTTRRLPERGRIGIFNRSYYEEVLVVRVHPEYLANQRLPHGDPADPEFWRYRLKAIRDHERHLARSGTVILKFFLNVSRGEQRDRFLSRLTTPHKQWKFSKSDLTERALWPQYMEAYQDALRSTSRPWAPWFAIPADSKPFMRLQVAQILEQTLDSLPLRFPKIEESRRQELLSIAEELTDAD